MRSSRSADSPRKLALGPREEHEVIRRVRQAQKTPQWQQHFNIRAGIEGTLGQGLRRCDLRRSRYRSLDKTRFQHVLTAAALDFLRIDAWVIGIPLATTRVSRFARLRPG
ncbi:transposase [Streptomyces sp. NBC_01483]|nr:transposase [Streptomyces sp. NBC_01483]